ncbi:hypothetical protein [Desulforhopalus sp. 52FAK]
MSKYRVPADFTERVMRSVRKYENKRKTEDAKNTDFLSIPLLRWGISCSAILLAITQLARLGCSLLLPVLCH